MSKIISNHKLDTAYDNNGNRIYSDKWKETIVTESKGGWRKYYMSGLDIFEVCISRLENQMARHLIESTRKGFILNITIKDLQNKFDISDKKAKTFIKKMRDIDYIRGSRGIYMTNPFMFIPYGMSDKDIAMAQNAWDGED